MTDNQMPSAAQFASWWLSGQLLANADDLLSELYKDYCDLERRYEKCQDAFKDLAEVAYGSRDAVWTSHRTLVRKALEKAREQRT